MRHALPLLAAAVVLVAAAACEDRAPTVLSPVPTVPGEDPPPVTPTPLPEGSWTLEIVALEGTAGHCALADPPETVVLGVSGAADREEARVVGTTRVVQLAGQSFVDAEGPFANERLSMAGAERFSHRPRVDCVLAVEERWRAERTAPGVLEGELVTRMEIAAGTECPKVMGTTEPRCETRRRIRLTHASPHPVPPLPGSHYAPKDAPAPATPAAGTTTAGAAVSGTAGAAVVGTAGTAVVGTAGSIR